jgi:hypothetical protein
MNWRLFKVLFLNVPAFAEKKTRKIWIIVVLVEIQIGYFRNAG